MGLDRSHSLDVDISVRAQTAFTHADIYLQQTRCVWSSSLLSCFLVLLREALWITDWCSAASCILLHVHEERLLVHFFKNEVRKKEWARTQLSDFLIVSFSVFSTSKPSRLCAAWSVHIWCRNICVRFPPKHSILGVFGAPCVLFENKTSAGVFRFPLDAMRWCCWRVVFETRSIWSAGSFHTPLNPDHSGVTAWKLSEVLFTQFTQQFGELIQTFSCFNAAGSRGDVKTEGKCLKRRRFLVNPPGFMRVFTSARPLWPRRLIRPPCAASVYFPFFLFVLEPPLWTLGKIILKKL